MWRVTEPETYEVGLVCQEDPQQKGDRWEYDGTVQSIPAPDDAERSIRIQCPICRQTLEVLILSRSKARSEKIDKAIIPAGVATVGVIILVISVFAVISTSIRGSAREQSTEGMLCLVSFVVLLLSAVGAGVYVFRASRGKGPDDWIPARQAEYRKGDWRRHELCPPKRLSRKR